MVSVLSGDEWRVRQESHHRAVDDLVGEHATRAARGERHPVEDFLFTYYRYRPAELRRWHPGPDVVLLDAAERSGWRFYRSIESAGEPGMVLDVDRFVAERADSVSYAAQLLAATTASPAQFGCFGLHEWAMVYADGGARRHQAWPLRLGEDGTDEVVRAHQIRCSHYDAFRFFTPVARPLNLLQPTLERRAAQEQPGCLHAGMDLYKWAYKLSPLVPSDVVVACFRLARRIRELDMRASPYDLRALGLAPVAIETADGKAEYVRAQREFAEAAQLLRIRLLAALTPALPSHAT